MIYQKKFKVFKVKHVETDRHCVSEFTVLIRDQEPISTAMTYFTLKQLDISLVIDKMISQTHKLTKNLSALS